MTYIPVAKPYLGEEEIAAVAEVMRSGMIASGPKVTEFERRFAEYSDVRHAVATSNGTTALHAGFLAAGIGAGDSVVVPSFSFIATATSVSMTGAAPVFADVDERTFTLDPDAVLEALRPDTKAVVGVHLYGQPFDVRPLREICDDHGLLLIEDAAQAHGADYRGKRVGGFADFGCFSFYPTKNMTTGEGGMVTTDDPALAERVRLYINHGQSRKYLHTAIGYNFRLTDMGAAVGLVQLSRLEGFNERRIHNAAALDRCVRESGLLPPHRMDGVRHVYHQYVVTVPASFPLSRDDLMQRLHEEGIGSAVHYPIPIHAQPVYREVAEGCHCPVSERLAASVLSLPVHPLVTDDDLARIAASLKSISDNP
ncbi:aminotransferase DegT [Methanoculleus taiwanensis]|uniref:Aminotransferase DegT n=1 Tax=Methanoculleus taiwanensis TaxID=1550565 RepID=A0A498H145_9EURY|nr:DegT/DnrJ/EryC1/StrS family aminotransferase [Methanoculleus taiwanensis]RXE56661.1 aminotransferase DegT [Methanoculleus taiwanensis]